MNGKSSSLPLRAHPFFVVAYSNGREAFRSEAIDSFERAKITREIWVEVAAERKVGVGIVVQDSRSAILINSFGVELAEQHLAPAVSAEQMQELEAQLRRVAEEEWAKHPNNPKARGKKSGNPSGIGTSLQGAMDASFAEICERLGPPDSCGDGYKVDAEWVRRGPSGVIFTIYNYKSGRNYLGPDAIDVAEIRDWHIGGYGKQAVEEVRKLFPNATIS